MRFNKLFASRRLSMRFHCGLHMLLAVIFSVHENAIGSEPLADNNALALRPETQLNQWSAGSEPEQATSPSKPGWTIALGWGVLRLPSWPGAQTSESHSLPYVYASWNDRVEISTAKGLVADLLHGEHVHGGLVGTVTWGRPLATIQGIPTHGLNNTVQVGTYLEYTSNKFTMGGRIRRDLPQTHAVYSDVYAQYELPKIVYYEHDVRIAQEGLNRAGMQRFFGSTPQEAQFLNGTSHSLGGGASRRLITYEAFQPVSETSGIAFSGALGQLGRIPSNSPLVSRYGARPQKELYVALVHQLP